MTILSSIYPPGLHKGCIIWLHGLGANGADMASLAEQTILAKLPLEHIFLDAPLRPVTINAGMMMQAWYDILGMKITDREDKEGIKQSFTIVKKSIEEQLQQGFTEKQIFLAGFSQGGAMALYTALHCSYQLGGVVSLSAYLPVALECKPILNKSTPFFIGGGMYDPIVQPLWTKQSEQWLKMQGFTNITWRQYPMDHSICPQEIDDISQWLIQHVEGV